MNISTQIEKRNVGNVFRLYYFVVFFGLGALFPLLGVYLKEYVHLSGVQVGNIMSIGPVIMIFAQPLWGMLCDYTQRPRQILLLTLLVTAGMAFLYSMTVVYPLLLLIAVLLAFGQSGVIPVSDSITLSYVQRVGGNYGAIRLYGALGYAAAVLISGKATDYFGVHVIFYIFTFVWIMAALLTGLLPKQGTPLRANIIEGAKTLLKKREFAVFLVCTFLIFGPSQASNTYLGLLISELGGTMTGIGFAFLLAAGSEAPFMRMAAYWIQKAGMNRILILAASVSALRWLLYFFEPPLAIIYATTISQGISVGLFIPTALQYVRDMTPPSMQSTAVSLYATAGGGVGAWFCTFIGGFLLDRFGIQSVYLAYFILTMGGLLVFLLEAARTKQIEEGLERKESA
jgi:PPP family 3-phenylpropionic acid transporter